MGEALYPTYQDEHTYLIVGDCVEVMAGMETDSVDAVVTDPPYGLEFMGKDWDKLWGSPGYNERGRITTRPGSQVPYGRGGGVNSYQAGRPMQEWHHAWAVEALRVLKPGGHLLAFGGTRTFHRLMCAIEDAGFEIRDTISAEGVLRWYYGSGFPKSLNVEKATAKMQGERRRAHGMVPTAGPESARIRAGLGTALKPAWEPIVKARKPIAEAGVARNVLSHGTGALNIDGCRVGTGDNTARTNRVQFGANFRDDNWQPPEISHTGGAPAGRWPANLVLSHSPGCVPVGERRVKGAGWQNHHKHERKGGAALNCSVDGSMRDGSKSRHYVDPEGYETVEAWECAEGCPVAEIDRQSGTSKSTTHRRGIQGRKDPASPDTFNAKPYSVGIRGVEDAGGASRFFYTAKASRKERGEGNTHPTVKPIALIRWLVRLVTPPGGLVLDCFAGSGTTLVAAKLEGLRAVGIEREIEYAEIAWRRVEGAGDEPTRRAPPEDHQPRLEGF